MPIETSSLPASRTWTVDKTHSTVGFRVTHHAVSSFRARFTEFEASYDALKGSLTGAVEAASLDTSEMLADHLRGPDFLDAEKHPRITFESSSIEFDDGVLTVVGDLTLKGVTKSVTTTGTFRGPTKVDGWGAPANEHIGIDLETTIDRRDYGVDFNNELLSGELNLGWDVTLEFSLEFSTPAE